MWAPVPLYEEGELAEGPPRWRAACKVAGMAALGTAIGLGFVALRWAMGLEGL